MHCCMLLESQSLCASCASPCGDLERGVGQILNATQVICFIFAYSVSLESSNVFYVSVVFPAVGLIKLSSIAIYICCLSWSHN